MRFDDQIVKAFKLIRGQKYYLVGEKSFAIHINKSTRALFGDSVFLLPEAGHWSMLDGPEVFYARVEQVADGLYAESQAEARHGVAGIFNPYKKCLPIFDDYEPKR